MKIKFKNGTIFIQKSLLQERFTLMQISSFKVKHICQD